MRQITSILSAVAVVFVSVGLAGSASAGIWVAKYDLTGSTSTTFTLLGTDVDQVTGTMEFRFQGGGSGETPVGAFYAQGDQQIDIYWQVFAGTPPTPVMTLDGHSDNKISGKPGGVSVTISGNAVLAFSTPDQTATGQMHCNNIPVGTPPVDNCAIAGFTNSVTVGLTPTTSPKPFPFPKLVFTGTKALVGDFTSTTQTQTATPNATVKFVYVGKEISRVYSDLPVPSDMPALSSPGLAGLGLSLALVGATSILVLRRRRGARRG
jgi:hypothetical protein